MVIAEETVPEVPTPFASHLSMPLLIGSLTLHDDPASSQTAVVVVSSVVVDVTPKVFPVRTIRAEGVDPSEVLKEAVTSYWWKYEGAMVTAEDTVPDVPMPFASHFSVPEPATIGSFTVHVVPASSQTGVGLVVSVYVKELDPN